MRKPDDHSGRGFTLAQAAHYYGVSIGTFKTLMKRGQAPGPIRIPGLDRIIWDRFELDKAMDALRDGAAA